jgi:hypothetical protein
MHHLVVMIVFSLALVGGCTAPSPRCPEYEPSGARIQTEAECADAVFYCRRDTCEGIPGALYCEDPSVLGEFYDMECQNAVGVCRMQFELGGEAISFECLAG